LTGDIYQLDIASEAVPSPEPVPTAPSKPVSSPGKTSPSTLQKATSSGKIPRRKAGLERDVESKVRAAQEKAFKVSPDNYISFK